MNKTAPHMMFLVNNEAINDNRVVKTAEVVASAGTRCTVVGCTRNATHATALTRNGVTYVITPLNRTLVRGLIAGLLPRLYTTLCNKWRTIPSNEANSEDTAITGAGAGTQIQPEHRPFTQPATLSAQSYRPPERKENGGAEALTPPTDPQLPLIKRLLKPCVGLARRAFRLILIAPRRIRGVVIGQLQPQRSQLGVVLLFGRYLATFYPWVHSLSETESVLYCHELWTLETGAIFKSRHPKIQLAYDSHELETHRNNNWSNASNLRRDDYERRYIRSAHHVATVCQSIADHLAELYGINTPHVVPNAPLAPTLRVVEPAMRLKALLDLQSEPLLVYTGKLTIGRGMHQVVAALPELANVHIAMVGPRIDQITRAVSELAISAGVSDRVHFVDAVLPQDLVSFISDADLAVVPIENVCLSYYYSLPNKLFEAAMAGLPILASDFPELRRFVQDYDAGRTVDFTNVNAVSSAIKALLEGATAKRASESAAPLQQKLSFEQRLNAFVAGIFPQSQQDP
ncbi:MAG: glycosyltransferase family 4 protein [Pseudomonadales bacterium]